MGFQRVLKDIITQFYQHTYTQIPKKHTSIYTFKLIPLHMFLGI